MSEGEDAEKILGTVARFDAVAKEAQALRAQLTLPAQPDPAVVSGPVDPPSTLPTAPDVVAPAPAGLPGNEN